MNAVFFLTFREGLEAALVVGVLFAALRALGAQKKNFVIWLGVFAGAVASFVFAWAFMHFTSGFEGSSEKLYEGTLMLLAAGIITHLIFWMKKQGSSIKKRLNNKVKNSLDKGRLWTIGILASIVVAREGIETVIFFQALFIQSGESISIVSGVLGVAAAVLLACVVYFSTLNVPISKLFTALSYFLILVAAGLVAHSIVEFQGADFLPTIIKPFYELSAILSEKEGIGSFLKSGFGYDANPSLLAVSAYWVYLLIVGRFYLKKNN